MSALSALLVPLVMTLAAGSVLLRGRELYPALTEGAGEGLRTAWRILPNLVILLPAVAMFRASGAMAALELAASPVLSALGIPPETAPLLLVRPLSGSAALAVGAELISRHGPDSPVGRTAAVMLGSTETTFYTITVYFGAVGVRRTRWTVPAALLADLTGFLTAAAAVRWLF